VVGDVNDSVTAAPASALAADWSNEATPTLPTLAAPSSTLAANAVAMIAADAAEADLAAEDPGAAESKGRLGAPFLLTCSRWRESSVVAP
jgi:hypothetical protein